MRLNFFQVNITIIYILLAALDLMFSLKAIAGKTEGFFEFEKLISNVAVTALSFSFSAYIRVTPNSTAV